MKKIILFVLFILPCFGFSQIEEVDVLHVPDSDRLTIEVPDLQISVTDYADDHIFHLVQVQTKPGYPEGIHALNAFIKENLEKPKDFPESHKGKVFVSFVVEKDGSLSNIKIIRDIGYGIGEEIVRTLKLSKKWKPGYINDKPVRVDFFYQITID